MAKSVYDDFAAAFAAEPEWDAALRLAADTLLERMASRPHEARFCFVEVLRGDHELLQRRDASRQRLIALFVREHGRRRGPSKECRLQLELLIGAAFQAIAATVENREIAELPALAPELESRAFVFA